MKKIFCLFLFVFSAACIQAQQVSKHANVEEQEVPVAVRQAFEDGFGSIPDGGKWTVYFTTAEEGERIVAQPKWYAFTKKSKGEKIEIRFTPKGELMYSRGLESKSAGDTSPTH